MAAKTIVITLPRHLKPAQPQVVPAPGPVSPLLGDFLRVVKDEPEDRAGDKPPRKRQRLDHLTQEEKIMRRKLKNRVAAQTARDRKKLRMDQLESQLADLTEHVSELTNLAAILTNKNTELMEQNVALQEKLAQCTCTGQVETRKKPAQSMTSSKEPKGPRVEGVMVPVTVPTDGSAASTPQQRAVGTLAVIRIMALSTLCSQWVTQAVMALVVDSALHQQQEKEMAEVKYREHPLPVKKRPMCGKWWGPQQRSWNPAGT
uniref:X-box-binding protein 1 n=1 Tax=Scylla olivacea TaxID=85551 RepID=A0A0P4VVL3_SCYOL